MTPENETFRFQLMHDTVNILDREAEFTAEQGRGDRTPDLEMAADDGDLGIELIHRGQVRKPNEFSRQSKVYYDRLGEVETFSGNPERRIASLCA